MIRVFLLTLLVTASCSGEDKDDIGTSDYGDTGETDTGRWERNECLYCDSVPDTDGSHCADTCETCLDTCD